MDSMKCCIAQDLMPLYIDDVLSEGSAGELRNHLESCACCQNEFRVLTKDLVLPASRKVQEENTRVLKKFKSSWTKKKILISVISSVLTVILLLFARDSIMESELFQPKTRACAGQVGQLYLGELSNGDEWTRLELIKKEPFSNITYWHKPYLIFDSPFYKKMAVNSGNSSSAVEMRILDAEGNIAMEPFIIEPGKAVSLETLESNTPYIIEYRAAGDYYVFTFM